MVMNYFYDFILYFGYCFNLWFVYIIVLDCSSVVILGFLVEDFLLKIGVLDVRFD